SATVNPTSNVGKKTKINIYEDRQTQLKKRCKREDSGHRGSNPNVPRNRFKHGASLSRALSADLRQLDRAVKPLTGYPDRAIAQTQRGLVMRAFVFACIGAIAIAIIGAVALGRIQESADQAFSTSAVRLGQE